MHFYGLLFHFFTYQQYFYFLKVLYQLGRNSNTHFFRYLLRHIEHDFTLKEKRAQREERRRYRRPTQHINGEQSDLDSADEDDDMNVSVVGSENGGGGNTTSSRRRHHKIAMAYNA